MRPSKLTTQSKTSIDIDNKSGNYIVKETTVEEKYDASAPEGNTKVIQDQNMPIFDRNNSIDVGGGLQHHRGASVFPSTSWTLPPRYDNAESEANKNLSYTQQFQAKSQHLQHTDDTKKIDAGDRAVRKNTINLDSVLPDPRIPHSYSRGHNSVYMGHNAIANREKYPDNTEYISYPHFYPSFKLPVDFPSMNNDNDNGINGSDSYPYTKKGRCISKSSNPYNNAQRRQIEKLILSPSREYSGNRFIQNWKAYEKLWHSNDRSSSPCLMTRGLCPNKASSSDKLMLLSESPLSPRRSIELSNATQENDIENGRVCLPTQDSKKPEISSTVITIPNPPETNVERQEGSIADVDPQVKQKIELRSRARRASNAGLLIGPSGIAFPVTTEADQKKTRKDDNQDDISSLRPSDILTSNSIGNRSRRSSVVIDHHGNMMTTVDLSTIQPSQITRGERRSSLAGSTSNLQSIIQRAARRRPSISHPDARAIQPAPSVVWLIDDANLQRKASDDNIKQERRPSSGQALVPGENTRRGSIHQNRRLSLSQSVTHHSTPDLAEIPLDRRSGVAVPNQRHLPPSLNISAPQVRWLRLDSAQDGDTNSRPRGIAPLLHTSRTSTTAPEFNQRPHRRHHQPLSIAPFIQHLSEENQTTDSVCTESRAFLPPYQRPKDAFDTINSLPCDRTKEGLGVYNYTTTNRISHNQGYSIGDAPQTARSGTLSTQYAKYGVSAEGQGVIWSPSSNENRNHSSTQSYSVGNRPHGMTNSAPWLEKCALDNCNRPDHVHSAPHSPSTSSSDSPPRLKSDDPLI